MKSYKLILKSFGIITTAITFSLVGVHKTTAQKAVKPNVLFILADDLGYNDLSCMGSRYYETPHVDDRPIPGPAWNYRLDRCSHR